MQKLTPLILIALIATVFSCKKNSTVTTLTVTVTAGATGSPASGATVNLYESATAATGGSPKYSQATDASGKTKFTVAYLAKYYVIVKSGAAGNYYSGYIPVGIFATQTDINDSPGQTPPAVVGGVRFNDTNHDGVINATDIVPAPSVDITQNANTNFGVVIY